MQVTLHFFDRPNKFLYFLQKVMRGMRCLVKKFNCFRIIITGKLRGGTKRTSSKSIGYGTVPYLSINKKIKTMFTPYRHRYGAFGVKFLFGYK